MSVADAANILRELKYVEQFDTTPERVARLDAAIAAITPDPAPAACHVCKTTCEHHTQFCSVSPVGPPAPAPCVCRAILQRISDESSARLPQPLWEALYSAISESCADGDWELVHDGTGLPSPEGSCGVRHRVYQLREVPYTYTAHVAPDASPEIKAALDDVARAAAKHLRMREVGEAALAALDRATAKAKGLIVHWLNTAEASPAKRIPCGGKGNCSEDRTLVNCSYCRQWMPVR